MKFKICIISDHHDWHSNKLKKEFLKKNVQVDLLHFSEISIKINNKKTLILFRNKNIKYNGAWIRFISAGSIEEVTFKLTLLHLMHNSGIHIHNSASVIEKSIDKSMTTAILKMNDINTPETWVLNNFKEAQRIIKTNLKNKINLLVKPMLGSQGKGIKLIKKISDIKTFAKNNKVFYLQRFMGKIEEETFSDYRVLISNHRVISVIKRTSKSVITNAFLGAKVEKIKHLDRFKNISEKASKIFKLSYAGLDFKIHRNKIYMIEINSIPSWKALQTVEKKNITEILVNDFLKLI